MIYDVAVIGGGAAGLMAAGRSGEQKARTILIEKNNTLGVKLLLTGGTRCNLTNYLEDSSVLAKNFGSASRFLVSAFTRFGPPELVDFFNQRGVKTKIENNNRVFPISNQAREVLNALIAYNKEGGVEIRTGTSVKELIMDKNLITEIVLMSGEKIHATNYILATGGRSYPSTGSTGDAYSWLKKMGHTIIEPSPALTPILLCETFVKSLKGFSREGVFLKLFQSDTKIATVSGDIIFTASGLSGPAALNISRFVKAGAKKNLIIAIDFFPGIEAVELDEKFQEICRGSNKLLKNSLAEVISSKLVPVLGQLSSLDLDKQSNSLTRVERLQLSASLKNFRLSVAGLEGYENAMTTTGGLNLKEVDPKTMRSKIISNLFVAGELLDVDGPTGGFNLQASWSTGRVAGESAAQKF